MSTTDTIAIIALIVSVIGVLVNLTYTTITFFLWLTTRKTVQLNTSMVQQNALMLQHLATQVEQQIALNHTSSEHKIIDSHRELFLSLIEYPQLLKLFAKDTEKSPEVVQRNILGTLLINHASAIYLYHKNNVINHAHLESYIKDARDLFTMPFLRARWKTVREFHTKEFQDFVEKVLLSEREIDYQALGDVKPTGKENLVELISESLKEDISPTEPHLLEHT